MKIKRLDELIETTLYEQPEEPEDEPTEDEPKSTGKKDDSGKSENEKDAEIDKKELKDVDKKDLEDEEDDEPSDEEVAVSIKFNDNVEEGGQIKLINHKKLSTINSIESILKLFKIDPNNVEPTFKDKIEITINSPLTDFKQHEYVVSLMDKSGEISVFRPDFKTTLTRKSKGNLGQAVQQATGEPEAEPAPEQIDLSYLPELESDFTKTVKNEFFNRILDRG